MAALTLANARVVLEHEVLHGSVVVADGLIVAVRPGDAVPPGALDLDGDLLLPGLIDLHTDHLERHYVPRPSVTWDPVVAVLAHDAQIIGAGITTAFDCIALSGVKQGIDRAAASGPLLAALEEADAIGALRAAHLVHLRCELTDETVPPRVAALSPHPRVRMLSMMDHSPGDRQFPDLALWLDRMRQSTGLSDAALEEVREQRLAAQMHVDERRGDIAGYAAARGLPLATHDDATAAHIDLAGRFGATITEFPTSQEAAAAAHGAGIAVMMGAPNLVRGGSHVGNLSAADCAAAGLLDVLASDYVPASLLAAALMLTRDPHGWSLPRAIGTVTAAPARAARLDDRGRIAPGLRADLVRIRANARVPVVREVWRAGHRVH